ncbi:uncharacterized protein [Setaria viridis]|uniref:uncharacterized protein n=1 Tax=Setaria viridis TaxID=4556 RepID=UPI003B3B4EAE
MDPLLQGLQERAHPVSKMIILKEAKQRDIQGPPFQRASCIIYILYCHLEMLPVLPACLTIQRPRGKGKAARPPSPEPKVEEEEEEELPSAHASGDDEEEAEEEEQQEQEGDGDGDGEAGDAQSKIWLQGSSSLPKRPIPEHLRPLIKPVGTKSWIKLSGGDHNRKANGILGLLCRVHFPGLVVYAGQQQPAYTWDHYVAAPDVPVDRGDSPTSRSGSRPSCGISIDARRDLRPRRRPSVM